MQTVQKDIAAEQPSDSNSYTALVPGSEEFERLKESLEGYSGKKRSTYWIVKRIFDIICSLVALILLSPLFLVLCIAICADDPHASCFYSQERVGRNGRTFRMWKFRSMVANADQMLDQLQELNEKDGPAFKIKDDPRITRVGRFIRKTSVDELPQLWNVLKGDMSIVGPRPALPSEVKQYTEVQKLRLLVTPGLTCYWQVRKNRDQIGFDEWVKLDLQYIRDRSWGLDLKLIFKTFAVIFRGMGE